MHKTFLVDCLLSFLLVFEVAHKNVSASEADLTIALGIGIVDAELQAGKSNACFFEGLDGSERFECLGIGNSFGTSQLTHTVDVLQIDVQVEEEFPC